MNPAESILAEIAAHDASMTSHLGLQPGDDWYLAAADAFAQERRKYDRLVRDLSVAQSKAQVVSPSTRGRPD